MGVIDFSALTAYVDQISSKLIKKAILIDRTLQTGVTITTGIKGSQAINILNSTLIGQATACGASPTGSVALSQRNITVCPLTVFEDICASQFDNYWTETLQPKGSYVDVNAIADIYNEDKVMKISQLAGQIRWRGSKAGHKFNGTTASATGNIILCDGWLEDLEFVAGSASVIQAGYTASSGFTNANALDIVDSIINTATTDASGILMQPNLNIYMSPGYFNTLTVAMRKANLYHYNSDTNQGGEYMIKNYLGTNFNVVAVEGLATTTRVVTTYAANLVAGFDMENDQDNYEVFYDRRLDTLYFRAKWKQASKVAFPEMVVEYIG